jgi:hypothetical protein
MKLTRENRSTLGKICPSATLSTTNPIWTDPESNPGLRGGGPAANRLSHGTAVTALVCDDDRDYGSIVQNSLLKFVHIKAAVCPQCLIRRRFK